VLTLAQPCRLAGDPFAARMLLPTVDGISRLHDTLLSVVLGVQLVLPDRHARSSTSLNAAASGELLRAARILSVYNIASYTLLITMGIAVSLERQLKARFLAQQGKQLVYGPAGWLWRGRREPLGAARPPSFVVVIVLAPAAFRLLWLLCMWLVPLLPYAPCDTCADSGTCAALAACGK
jgi:hypothetical protein